MEIIIVVLAILLWLGVRSRSHEATTIEEHGVRIGCGFPLALMLILALILLTSAGSAMLSGDCDPNARSGQAGNCLDVGGARMEDALGWKHYDNMQQWWDDPVNPFK